jgi:hypothetical protein
MNPNMMKFRRSPNFVVDEVPTAPAPALDLSSMSWGELTKLGREHGVFKVGMKRAAVEAEVKKALA